MDDRWNFLHPSTPVKAQEHVFQHRHPIRGDVAVQYWSRRDGSSEPPEHLLVFILGNPGLLGYYPPFLDHLHSLLPRSFAILSSSHIGHSPDLSSPTTPLTLPEQLETKIELVQSLSSHLTTWAKKEDVPHPRISLIGHSVGAWISCEVIKRIPSKISGVFMLFPTVGWISETWNGRTLWPIFHAPMRQLLPLLSPLLRLILPLTSFPPSTLSLLRSQTTIQHCLDLSGSEMETIRDPDLDWFSHQADPIATPESGAEDGSGAESAAKGVHGIWSGGTLDGWVGREGGMVRDALGGENNGRVKVLDGVPHAFCLTQKHSERVADALASWLVPSPQIPESSRKLDAEEMAALADKLPM